MQTEPAHNKDTYPRLLLHHAAQRPNELAVRFKRYGIWQAHTWDEVAGRVRTLAAGFASLGVKAGDSIGIIGNNIPQLYWSMTAAQCLGAVPVPIYADAQGRELANVVNDAHVRIAVVQDQQQVDALLEKRDQCPGMEEIIFVEERGLSEYNREHLHSLDHVLRLGETYLAEHPNVVDEAIANAKPDDVAMILYTSGVTADPRGAMLTHSNMISTAAGVIEHEKLTAKEEVLAMLPLAWAANILFVHTASYVAGFCVSCPESSETVLNDIGEVGPTYFYAPPHIYKLLVAVINNRIESSSRLDYNIFHFFTNVAMRVGGRHLEGRRASPLDALMMPLGRLFVFSPLKNTVGLTRVRVALTSGDSVSPDVFRFFRVNGINLKHCYGLTECAACATIERDGEVSPDSVGKPMKDVDIKLDDDGQVLVRGPNVFKGYYNNAEATAQVLDSQGWLRTGDEGKYDDNGALHILDRLANIGTTSDGKVFTPKLIESRLKSSPYVKEAVVFGDQRDSAGAFIIIDPVGAATWADRRNVRYTGYADLTRRDAMYDLIKEHVDNVNRELASDETHGSAQVSRFLILHRQLSAERGEITRTSKLRRGVIAERYAQLVEALHKDQQEAHYQDSAAGSQAVSLRICKVEPVTAAR